MISTRCQLYHSAQTTKTSGPNGNIDWLGCGITSTGWTPPPAKVTDLVYADLSNISSSKTSPFKACAPYLSYFNAAAQSQGIPPIFLAAFAMMESSCNPNAVGSGGELGLFQITPDRCQGKSTAACKDPAFNTNIAAQVFAAQLKAVGGNVFTAVGEYVRQTFLSWRTFC